MEADLCYRSAAEAARMLRAGETSSVELTQAVLRRIERLDGRLHSYLTVTAERALESARKAQAELSAGRDRGPLHGIPIALKDLIDVAAVRRTCASRVLADAVPREDATVAERLEAAGAVLLGKLNLTEFAMSGYHPSLPIPVNPWNEGLSTGGSSSGSGVATAAGLCFASLGTDTGGSIRIPSAWCGVVGLKPSYGRVSRHGVFPLGMTLDHVGPMTRTVADAAAVLEIIAGRDARDPTSSDAEVPACRAALGRGVRGVRIGVDENFSAGHAHPDVIDALSRALHVLEEQGARVVRVSVPNVDDILEGWFVLCAAEALVAHQATYPSRAADYGPTFRSFLEYGSAMRAQDYAKAHVERVDFARRFQGVFAEADVFACPGGFMVAPPADALDPYGPVTSAVAPFIRFTAPFNFSGNPTLSLPAGFDANGAPHGIQLVGPLLGEALLCQVGAAYENASEWHLRHPRL